MGDDNMKDGTEAGTSREDQGGSTHNLREDRNQDDKESYTNSTESTAYSETGRAENVAERRANILKAPVLKKAKITERKQRRRPSGGRVVKRNRSQARRRLRKAPMRKARPQNQRQYRAPSASTIFTRRSSMSGSSRSASGGRGCEYCGHRCCRRRFEDELRRYQKRARVKRQPRRVTMAEAVQAGSRSAMLSPLYINANATPDVRVTEPSKSYCDVTPQMIYESLKRLSMMKQNVPLVPIANDMKGGKRADVSSGGKRSAPPMDTRNTKGIADALPTFKGGIWNILGGSREGSKGRGGGLLGSGSPANLTKSGDKSRRSDVWSATGVWYHPGRASPYVLLIAARLYHLFRERSGESIKRHFPVNPDKKELHNELLEKLQVAVIVGFVVVAQYRGEDAWCLYYDMRERKLSENHITRFWKVYADTMTPITRTEACANTKGNDHADGTDTNDKSRGNYHPARFYSEHYI